MATISQDAQLLPLLETLEDTSTSHTEQTDAYLSIANRLSGEDGKEFTVLVGRQFSRLCKVFKTHISHQNSDLSNAALQTLGFCVFYHKIASNISATEVQELLSSLNNIAVKASDKNTCTRALWVISKQNFPSEEVGKVVPSILSTLENVLSKDLQSLVIAYEALNVVIRLLEQAPTQMTEEAVRWAKLIIPLVVHSAPKVRIRAATALEIGVPLLLQKSQEVAAITEQLMTSKIIGELHKLFTNKNETYVLKLWPLFVKLLGKTLHRSGNFINSLLQLEELGFRNGSPAVKKIAFIAWKSLIDNFALNPDILCSTKRLKLLMQPLSSIHVKTEALALTKVEVWWYLLMRLGSQLPVHFEQVCLPLIQSALSVDSIASTPLRSGNPTTAPSTPLQKGPLPFGSPATPKINLNSSLLASVAFPSVHLLGVEMMLHFLLGPEAVQFAQKHKLVLSLEPLQHPLISSSSFFSKYAATLLNAVQDGFITIGKDASGAVLHAVWKDMIEFVKAAMDTGSKKERQGSEVLTFLLQSLKNIIVSDALQVEKCMSLLECSVKGLPQKVLGSAAYHVANMDLLNGTPALFLIQLHFHAGILKHGVTEERFFINFETLVSYVLSGPTSPLAFSESVLHELNQGAKVLENKELLWRMWSILINPLTEKVNQTNEVNQGDALEHNFSAMHSALMLPISHIFPLLAFPQPTMKMLMRTWSELYKAFARCAALVTTTDENVCCEELCSRILAELEDQSVAIVLLERLVLVVTVIVDCTNFTPYSTKFQPKTKAPLTPTDWAKKKKGPLGNLNSLFKLLVKLIEEFHTLCSDEAQVEANASALSSVGSSILSSLCTCISHITVPSILRTVFLLLTKPIAVFYMKTKSESPKVYSALGNKLDKLLGDVLSGLGSRYTGSYDNDLLECLSPLLCAIFLHKNKPFRTQAAQFWNGSFAKAATLVYPEELKPILSQVKLKTPLLLPGFTFTSTAEESSGPYSDNLENSQLGTKVSGIEVKSTGKRDSLLARTEERKDKGTPTKPLQAKKLDFSSPNPKKKILEEEQSVDFVFIPPETKERVLTEHQKEVLRTKRVDIPTMYNNLDASQDTTLFSQYTQSQDISLDKPAAKVNAVEETAKTKENTNIKEAEEILGDKSMVQDHEMEDKADDVTSLNDSALNTTKESPERQNTSNVSNNSSTSDLVMGTPPPPVSRRQSFITLEKFDGNGSRTFSPLSDSKFTKATEITLVPDSQETKDKKQRPKEKGVKKKQEPEKQTAKPVSRRSSRALRLAEDTEKKPEETIKKSVTVAGDVMDDFVPDSQVEDNVADLEGKENALPETSTDCKEKALPETSKEKALPETSADCKEKALPETSIDCKEKALPERTTNCKENAPPETSTDCKEKALPEDYADCKENTPPENSMDCKENTPPEKSTDCKENTPPEDIMDCKENTPPEDANKTKSEPQKTHVSQISLRRSSRRQSEILEGVKKETSTERRSQTKEEQKTGLKASSKETPSKQANEDVKTHEKDNPELPTNSQVENKNTTFEIKKELPDASSSEEMTRGRPRYQTRRSLQAIQASGENSESDHSEPREGTLKRKRGRPKKSDQNEKTENGQESQVEENTLHASQTEKDIDGASVVSEMDSQSDIDGDTYTIGTANSRSKFPRLEADGNTELYSTMEVNKTYDVAKTVSTTQSLMTEPTAGDFSTAVSDVFPNSETSPDCPHKRSRRVRKSKGCDCCKVPIKEGRNFTELKSEDTENKNKTINASSYTQFNDTFSRPCAMSTPLVTTRQQAFFKGTVGEIKSDTESEMENSVSVNESKSEVEEVTQIYIKNKALDAVECSNEPTIQAENVNSSEKVFGKTYSITEQSTATEKRFKTFDIDPKEVSVSDMGYEKPKGEEPTECILMDNADPPSSLQAEDTNVEMAEVSAEHTDIDVTEVSSEKTKVQILEATFEKSKVEEAVASPEETNVEMAEAADEEVRVVTPASSTVEAFNDEADLGTTKASTDQELGTTKEANETENGTAKVCTEEADFGTADGSDLGSAKACPDESDLEADVVCVGENNIGTEKASAKVTDAELAKAPAEEAVGDMDDILVTETEGELASVVEINTVCEEPTGEMVLEAVPLEHDVDPAKQNADLEQENAQTFCEEKRDTITDQLTRSTLSEEANDEEDLTVISEKSALQMAETLTTDVGDGHGSTDSPPKLRGFTTATMTNDSPSGSFSWSPSASPSTSILKKGLKRQQQEIDSPSPLNKIRRVSFANPIYQEGLADDIDRRSPVIRNNSSNNSPSSRSLKMLTSAAPKINTTPTKGFVSPGSRVLGFKSSKKSLISEMTKESMPSPKESVYPALMNCATPVDIILPQITSNMWARGLGQLIRAKNIKTIGDLSTLTSCEIKMLPVRSPKVSTVKKALRAFHEQQTRVKGFDEFAALDETEKPLNGLDEKPLAADEEVLETEIHETSTKDVLEASPAPDLQMQISALSQLFTPEELGKYSGSQLFEIQEKLGNMSNCLLRHLQSRWRSPPHDGSA